MTADSNEQGTVRYMRCGFCGNMNPASSPTCARCGKALARRGSARRNGSARVHRRQCPPRPSAAPQVVCPKCNKAFPLGSKFCGYCGTPLPTDCAATQGGRSTRTGTATRGAATSGCATGPAQTCRPTPPGDTSAGAASAAARCASPPVPSPVARPTPPAPIASSDRRTLRLLLNL